MKYLFWFILPLLGLIIVIQTVVVNPLSGGCSGRKGAAAIQKEVDTMTKPVLLCIMDGFGKNESDYGNAIVKANTPRLDELMNTCGV